MSLDSIVVANEFLKHDHDHRFKTGNTTRYVNALELHKLVVIAHGYHKTMFDEKLVEDTLYYGRFEPTFKRLANVLKLHGNEAVESYLPLNGEADIAYFGEPVSYNEQDLSSSQLHTISTVWRAFFDNTLKCHHLSYVTRGGMDDWKSELGGVSLEGNYSIIEYPIEQLVKRVDERFHLNEELDAA